VFEPLAFWAAATPSKLAVVADGVSWSYSEFESRSNQLAAALAARGIKAGDRVSFVLPRGPSAVLLLVSILKVGAAYVPIDAQSPPGRIADCLEDADPALVIAEERSTKLIGCLAPICAIEELLAEAESLSTLALMPQIEPDGLAYIIFTSGTTGRPKGVPITHAALTNFIIGNQAVCIRVEPDDKVLQCFSPASDGHHEEVWPTFLAGATLVVASPSHVHSGEELAEFLNHQKITIISCAPTLLSMVDVDIPTLRRVLFGAESLSKSMIERWWKPTREILNTYGPTEATVGASFGYCTPGQPVTIGQALPGYDCYVMNDDLEEVLPGHEGELTIAGIGVSNGYFRREELSLGRFLENPYYEPERRNKILYKTGDRVVVNHDGNIVWLGRIDNQVKIRGHRIELSEIESHVLAEPSVQTAVVIVRGADTDNPQLIALVRLKENHELEFSSFLERMREAMPAYMVPQSVELVESIPVLPSGKIDRGACASLHGHTVRIEREILPPMNDTESLLLSVWQELFATEDISCDDNFFLELGGYSLLASRIVSTLRSSHGYPGLSVLDLYENPTIRSLASLLDGLVRPISEEPIFVEVSKKQYRIAKVVMFFCVLALFGIQAVTWLGPILAAIYLSNNGLSDFHAFLVGLGINAVQVPILFLFVVIAKRITGGSLKEGTYPLWGPTFLRWWFANRILAIAPIPFITGTPLATVFLRALGAKVGKNVTFESLDIDAPGLISIGDDCSFENSAWLHAATVSNGQLHLRKISIGNGCVVGVRSGVAGGGVMEDGSVLRDLGCIKAGNVIPANEEWAGSPAHKVDERLLPPYDPKMRPSKNRLMAFAILQTVLVAVLAVLDSIPFLAIAFTLYNESEGIFAYLMEPVYAIALVLFACGQALIIKWLVIGKLKPGVFKYPGGYWLRKWFADKHLELMTGTLVPIYDSLFTRNWCQALGMKCGPRCEIALPRRMPYDLVEMGEESFLASEVSIGMPLRRNGTITLLRTIVGKRVFLGNDSVVPQGSNIPDESLLGVLSASPDPETMGDEVGQAWLGSPAFKLPRRQVTDSFGLERTYRPSKRLYIERLFHEGFRIILPSMFSLMIAAGFIEAFVEIWDMHSIVLSVLSLPILYLVTAFLGACICKFSKWLLV
ncbi:MAG: amino acid adenylation domain-containing protein, partial [Armatimonadota bacterium]